MAEQIINLKDVDGDKMYPVTLTSAVVGTDGELLEDRLAALEAGGVGGNVWNKY